MRRLLTTGLLLSAIAAVAQTPEPLVVPSTPAAALSLGTAPASVSPGDDLPDAPGEAPVKQAGVVAVAETSFATNNDGAKPCNAFRAMKVIYVNPNRYDEIRKPCSELIYPYQRFLNTEVIIPMTWQQKGYLALHDLTDPANFGTILGISAITIGADSHTAYGPGLKGFGKIVGVSLLEDAPASSSARSPSPLSCIRIRATSACPTPNYQNASSTPSRAPLSVGTTTAPPCPTTPPSSPTPSARSSQPRTCPASPAMPPRPSFVSLPAMPLDPANNLLNEFLPDVAAHVHVRIIFVQRILNNIASGANGVTLQ